MLSCFKVKQFSVFKEVLKHIEFYCLPFTEMSLNLPKKDFTGMKITIIKLVFYIVLEC